ncbi:L-aminoadipate-semialdehyde dehydrogenase-phosphopantetheinyl transferase-like isoform X2 [Ornithodoros turicata]|uniref:L-aminoadipate-semialdehyde dehydrogenase-phosphopantetheinyl transferase-like isoform X2 n=1 Tax=Ornithodoros turicata TaxID=34597 RepID=UPI0031387852
MGCRPVRWAFNCSKWTPTREEWLLASRCIQAEEKDRIGLFYFARDAKASMAGRLLLRKCISESLSLPYNQIRLGRDENNRPIILSPEVKNASFDLNVSHQGSFSVLAADHSEKVGVDIMKIEYSGGKAVHEFFRLMRRQFTPSEWGFIEQPGTERELLSRFYRLWCLKEGFVKAEGVGLGMDLQRLSFSCETPWLQQRVMTCDTRLFMDGVPLINWQFQETLLDGDHCVCTALQVEDKAIPKEIPMFTILTFEELMSSAVPLTNEVDEGYWSRFEEKPVQPS